MKQSGDVINVNCPFLPCKHREDWGLEDSTGKTDEEFIKVINMYRRKSDENEILV